MGGAVPLLIQPLYPASLPSAASKAHSTSQRCRHIVGGLPSEGDIALLPSHTCGFQFQHMQDTTY